MIFGNIKKTVLASYGPPDPKDAEFPKEIVFETLKLVGQIEGFDVIPTKVFYYVRDAKVRCMDGTTYLRTTDTEDNLKSTAIDRMVKRENHLKTNHSLSMTSHPLIIGCRLGKGIVEGKNHRRAGDGYIVKDSWYDSYGSSFLVQSKCVAAITPSRSPWEGGNVSASTNLHGRVKVLMGEDHLTVTHQILRQAGYFKFEKKTKAFTQECGQSCTFYMLNDELNKMFKNQEFPKLVEERTPHLTNDEIIATGKEMNAMGLINNFKAIVTEESREITEQYVGQRAFVREILWPKELKVDSADIQVIKQGDYHLDVFLKPNHEEASSYKVLIKQSKSLQKSKSMQ